MGIAEQLAEQAQLAKEKIGGLNSNIQQLPKSVSEEIIIELSSISDTDMITMNSLPEFIEANNLYNQHFQLFLLNKFKEEFSSTKEGKLISENLLKVIRDCKTKAVEINKQRLEDLEEFKRNQFEFEQWKKERNKL
jgi:hypothetical protein|nr:MAG: hypothetical protein [Bacteriophage sp.]DAF35535.1 MAG TPA: hypothetical protein [Crassvirales sp.]